MTNATRKWIKVSRAKMPNSCWGGNNYYRAAVIETKDGTAPKIIRDTANQTVITVREDLYRGKTDQCGLERAIAELQKAYPGAEVAR